jgi:hypothetical protein
MAWLAADETGAVAAMITGGAGPIPAAVLANSDDDVFGIEEALLDLQRVGTATVHYECPDPSSFLALSERGLFVYDWSDIHRTLAEARGEYELVASPSVVVRLPELPPGLRRLAARLEGRAFGDRWLRVS